MTAYVINGGVSLLVRVDYADAAGGYAGWFLLNVDGDALDTDVTGGWIGTAPNDAHAYLSQPMNWSTVIAPSTAGPAAENTGGVGSGTFQGSTRYRPRFLALVHGRLERMFGIGHSATWTATLLESVTPAVIDDSF